MKRGATQRHFPGLHVAPYAGAWIEKRCKSVTVIYIPFYREKKIYFSYYVLSMYLTFTDLHFPSFSGFFALFGDGRLQQKGDVIRRALVPKRGLLRKLAVRSKIRLPWRPVRLLSHLRQYLPPICQHCALQSGDAGGNRGLPLCLHNIVMSIWHPRRTLRHLD